MGYGPADTIDQRDCPRPDDRLRKPAYPTPGPYPHAPNPERSAPGAKNSTTPPNLGTKNAICVDFFFVVSPKPDTSCEFVQHVPHSVYEVAAIRRGRKFQPGRPLATSRNDVTSERCSGALNSLGRERFERCEGFEGCEGCEREPGGGDHAKAQRRKEFLEFRTPARPMATAFLCDFAPLREICLKCKPPSSLPG